MTSNAKAASARLGVQRGLIEFRQLWTNSEDVVGQVVWLVLLFVPLIFMRNAHLPGTSFSLGAAAVPGLLGAGIVFNGVSSAAGYLMLDREDGTLLRAKATPHGMNGLLLGKVVALTLSLLIGTVLLLVPSMVLFPSLDTGPGNILGLLGVLLLGMAATLPLGAAIGALISNPRMMGILMMPVFGLMAISGIFYPVTALPVWVQDIAQVFPMYWLGLGMRSALLPDATVMTEIGQSWRTWGVVGVLAAWAVLGLALAPGLLRRMAQRESGSAMSARRERAMQRAV